MSPAKALTEKEQASLKAILAKAKAIREAIKELGSIPEGHLYAILMGHMNLMEFDFLIGLLVKAGEITRSNHLLTYVKEVSE